MTQKNKELLLKDLCARLPYGVKVQHLSYQIPLKILSINSNGVTWITGDKGYPFEVDWVDCKPCLFPLSSMTEDQYQELNSFNLINCAHIYEIPFKFHSIETFSLPVLEWFLKHHFDVNGLLEKGLAINAIELNIY